jgi:hypothetical protein
VKAKFAIELPSQTWIATPSREFPDTQFRLLTGIAVDGGAVELGEIVGPDVDGALAAITDHEAISDYELLYESEERALAQYHTSERSLYGFLRGYGLPPEFPIVVEGGWFEFEVTAPREQIRDFRSMLEGADWSHEVLAVGQDSGPDDLLTDRQRELLDAALVRGYFAVPRECTLAELAADLDVDKSTASGVLRRAVERLVTWFVTGAGGGTDQSSLRTR